MAVLGRVYYSGDRYFIGITFLQDDSASLFLHPNGMWRKAITRMYSPEIYPQFESDLQSDIRASDFSFSVDTEIFGPKCLVAYFSLLIQYPQVGSERGKSGRPGLSYVLTAYILKSRHRRLVRPPRQHSYDLSG